MPADLLLDEALTPASRAHWIIAALAALAIHASIAVAVFHYMSDATNDLGAPGLVIDVDLNAPPPDPTDLPVGPSAEALSPAPPVMSQKAVVEVADLPRAIPTETDNPDWASTLDEKKADEQDPKAAAVQAAPSNASVTSEATTLPSVDGALPSQRSATPALGTGNRAVRDRVTWEKELAAHFDKFKRYPYGRTERGAEVVVTFVLDSMGHVISTQIKKSSGDSAFDAAALAMLKRADPVPPPPPAVAEGGLAFTLPVIFHSKGPI